MSAFLTDADWHLTLSAIRSLGKRNIEVVAGGVEGHNFSFRSRYCRRYVRYPPLDTEHFLNSFSKLVKEEKSDVLIPISDDILISISKNIKLFEDVTMIPIPDFKTVMKAADKLETMRSATKLDIPAPKTYSPENGTDLNVLSQKIDYPLIVKPRMGGRAAAGVLHVNSPKDLLRAYKLIKDVFGSVIVQEYIPGGSTQMRMVNALYNKDSEPIAIFTAKKLREYPITGGVTTCGESIWDPRIAELGKKLLDAWKWYGVAEIEFKVDPRDNTPKLIEVNPRFWTYLQLPIYCGINFPYLLYKIALDEDVSPIEKYKTGIKYVHPLKDPLSILKILYKSRTRKSFYDLLSSYRGEKTYAIFSWNDPVPIIGKFISAVADNKSNNYRSIGK